MHWKLLHLPWPIHWDSSPVVKVIFLTANVVLLYFHFNHHQIHHYQTEFINQVYQLHRKVRWWWIWRSVEGKVQGNCPVALKLNNRRRKWISVECNMWLAAGGRVIAASFVCFIFVEKRNSARVPAFNAKYMQVELKAQRPTLYCSCIYARSGVLRHVHSSFLEQKATLDFIPQTRTDQQGKVCGKISDFDLSALKMQKQSVKVRQVKVADLSSILSD